MNHITRMTRTELDGYIRNIDVVAYARQRNYIGGSTGLSEYITRGAISLPNVRQLLLEKNTSEAAYKLLNELAWREYWHLVWRMKGDGIFEYIRPLRTTVRPGIPTAILAANTGINALDDGIRQLQQTGYIHNHMRMWLAGLICNVARCDWKVGADWMHSYLIDGDYASNHLSWQWVAGSYTGNPYLPQQDNINTYTETVQHNTYLDQPYSVIADMAVPAELLETSALPPLLKPTGQLPANTTTIEALTKTTSEILLYSPWTLDGLWRSESLATRLLLLDSDMFGDGKFSQNTIDSIVWFAGQIPGLEIICEQPTVLTGLASRISRKYYAGISNWPGQVDPNEALYPQIEPKFYPSFSAFWKQAQKQPF